MRRMLLCTTLMGFVASATSGHAAQPVNGEGASSVIPTLNAEFAKEAAVDPGFAFTAYGTTSVKGQTAFFANAGTAGSGVPSGQSVDFGISDGSLTSAAVASWNSTDAAVDGPLISMPLFGTGVAIPFTDPGANTNGALRLTDGDLCAIFSGKATSYAQLSANPPGGTGTTFRVVYRTDPPRPPFC